MKKFFCSLLFFAATCGLRADAGGPTEDEWGPIVSNAQMSIHLKDAGNEIKTNQPVVLSIRIRNLSTNETFIFLRQIADFVSPPEISFIVVSPSGKELSPATYGPAHGSARFVAIPPQRSVDDQFNLRRFYKFNEMGTYKIIAKWGLENASHTWGVIATSNPLYLTVAPGEWKEPPNGKPN